MFGISFWELLLIGLVALLVVGPDKLPKMLGTLGRWSNKLRRITTEVRQQTGIDDLLRQNGIKGGLDEIRELRNIVKGNVGGLARSATGAPTSPAPTLAGPSPTLKTAGDDRAAAPPPRTLTDIYADMPSDRSREYPEEGCDSYGCLADDLWTDPDKQAFEDEKEVLLSPPDEQNVEATANLPEEDEPEQASSRVTPAPENVDENEPDAERSPEVGESEEGSPVTCPSSSDPGEHSQTATATSPRESSSPPATDAVSTTKRSSLP